MASGFSQISNNLMFDLMKSGLNGRERMVLDVIIFFTLGNHRESDIIPYGEIAKLTGIDRRSVIRIVSSLSEKRWISVKKRSKGSNVICIKKGYLESGKGGGKSATSTGGKSDTYVVANLPPFTYRNTRGHPADVPLDGQSLDDTYIKNLEDELGDDW